MIAAGGAVGALLRYGLGGLVHRLAGDGFPWGTLGVNLLGCFVIGFLWVFSEQNLLSSTFSTFVFIGVLGAFTTFSTYSLESINLLRSGELQMGLVNFFASNSLGFLAVLAGLLTARALLALLR